MEYHKLRFFSFVRATFPTHLILLVLITHTTFKIERKCSWVKGMCLDRPSELHEVARPVRKSDKLIRYTYRPPWPPPLSGETPGTHIC